MSDRGRPATTAGPSPTPGSGATPICPTPLGSGDVPVVHGVDVARDLRQVTTRAGHLLDRAAPPVLGHDFRWLWAQSTITNLGDGVLLSAGPLLVTTITREPFAVAMAVFLQQLPWVVFGMPAGAIIDRVDRRRLTILVNVLRGIVLLALTATVATGTVNLAVVLTAVFLIGTAETFSDNASGALLATHVPKVHLGLRQLPLATARPSSGNRWPARRSGAPVRASAWPCRSASMPPAHCSARSSSRGSRRSRRRSVDDRERHLRHEIADGIRWLVASPAHPGALPHDLFFNITFGASMACTCCTPRSARPGRSRVRHPHHGRGRSAG